MIESFLKRLMRDQSGATAIEYGLICGLVVMAMLVAMQGFTNENNRTWITVASKTMAATSNANGA